MKTIKVITGVFIFCSAVLIFIFWIDKKAKKEDLVSWISVKVVDIDRSVPPGLYVEVENSGPRSIGKTHFRLMFTIENRLLCRVDTDYGGFQPQSKRKILLKCKGARNISRRIQSVRKKIQYVLMVYPEWKKPLEPIKGEFSLKEQIDGH